MKLFWKRKLPTQRENGYDENRHDAAGDLISDYTLTYNQLRQGKITTELAEITAGRIALE